MNYLEIAPAILVELHKQLLANENTGSQEASWIESMLHSVPPEDRSPRYEKRIRRLVRKLPFTDTRAEYFQVLGRVLTDERMRKPWEALKIRFQKDSEGKPLTKVEENEQALSLIGCCADAVKARKRVNRKTPEEFALHFVEISNCANKLEDLLADVEEFDDLNSATGMSPENFEEMLSEMGATLPKSDTPLQFTLLGLKGHLASFSSQLAQIADNSARFASEATTIKKNKFAPTAQSDKHFLIVQLHYYFMKKYNSPMHEVVAGLTMAALNLPADEDISIQFVSYAVKDL